MKSFFIKAGKVINSLKQEGFVPGSKKTIRYFGVFLKNILMMKSGDVLFVTGGVGDSARFRTHNVAEELRFHGFRAYVTMPDNPFLLKLADKFKIFIFHKTIFTPKIEKFLAKIKMQKKEIIFDADDLLFDPAYLEKIDYLQNTNPLEAKIYETGLNREILTDPYVATCTATTSFLAEILKTYGKKVFIVPNRLSDKDVKIADEILKAEQLKDNDVLKIGYFSGSAGHNKDFATIINPLAAILQKYPEVKLVLAGPLEISEKLRGFNGRIIRLPFVSREKYFKNLAGIDINTAPLEINNPFCESKSELKFFGAGILKIPTVAVRNQTFGEAITDGVDGFLAGTENEWLEKLEKLIPDESSRKEIGEKAYEKTLRKYTNKNSDNEEYYNYLRSKL